MAYLWTVLRPYILGAVLGSILAVILVLVFDKPPAPVSSPATPKSASAKVVATLSQVQTLIDADRLRTTVTVPLTAKPAVDIVSKVLPGFTAGQISTILAASRAPTVTAVVATAKLVGPSPAPAPTSTALDLATIVAADKTAVESVLADPATHIATTVTLSQQEVEPSRLGSAFGADGSGLMYAVLRRNLVDIDVGAVARGAHVSPAIGVSWRIPHTSLSIGPRILYDHGLKPGVQAIVQFGP